MGKFIISEIENITINTTVGFTLPLIKNPIATKIVIRFTKK